MPHKLDKPMLMLTLTILVAGFLILASASMVLSQKNFGTISFYILRQFLYGGILGGLALAFTQWLPYRTWKRLALPLIFLSFLLSALLFLPQLSYIAGGARRWLQIGGFSFQPSEVLKLSFLIYLASWLDARRKDIKSISYGMVPFSIMLTIVGTFLVMQRDIGTLGVIMATAGILYFLGGGKISQMAMLSLFGLIMLFLLIHIEPYRLQRILVFFKPQTDPQGIGYQINQAFIGIGSGGFWGLGFGKSLQKYSYLPEPMGDSIFAIFAEEVGFIGACALLALFAAFFWRGILIAKRAPDVFGKLLAAGISVGIITQAFINMSAISGLLPLTGIPLPMVSYGGTSLVITLASIGVLLNISKYT